MNDALRVGGVQRIGNLDRQIEQDLGVAAAAPQSRCFNVMPVQKLHRDERLALVSFADFVYGANVGMVQGRGCARLSCESVPALAGLVRHPRAGTSKRQSGEFGVLSLVDHTHPATAEFLDDAVVRDGLANHFEENSNPRRTQS